MYDVITLTTSSYTRLQACLTLWRIYQYVDADEFEKKGKEESANDEEYKEIQETRSEMWCYNCADSGHLGDDCGMRRGCPIPLIEPSAFSEQNLFSGPFKTALIGDKKKGKSSTSRRAKQLDKASGYPANTRIPDSGGPGSERRRKEKEHLKRLADESSDDSDDYDRFIADVNGVGDGASKKSRKNRRGQRARERTRRDSGSSNGYQIESDRESLLNSRRRQA